MNLPEDEVERLVDLLRRNLLYQTPTIGENNGQAVARVRMHLRDFEDLLALIDKAGGWDLGDEERARLLARDCAQISKALEVGADVSLAELTAGEVMMLLEVAEDKAYRDVADACMVELQRRSQQN